MVETENTIILTANEIAVTLNRNYRTVVRVLAGLVDDHIIIKTTKFINNREVTGYCVPSNLLPIKRKFQLMDARKPSTLKSLHKIQKELSNLNSNKKQSIVELLADIQKELNKNKKGREGKSTIFDLKFSIGEHEIELSLRTKKKELPESIDLSDEFPDEVEY